MQLRLVQHFQPSCHACASILGHGSVVNWGHGNSMVPQKPLRQVQQVQVSCRAFTAVSADGSWTNWGHDCGRACCVKNPSKPRVYSRLKPRHLHFQRKADICLRRIILMRAVYQPGAEHCIAEVPWPVLNLRRVVQ